MNDIKVGEYIRTNSLNHGFIQKAIYVDDEVVYYSEHCKISKKAITKHSPNIIDLIEVKDLVHIILCDEDDIDGENPMETIWYIDNEYILANVMELIQSKRASLLGIVTHEQFFSVEYKTHEQFSSMEYRLGGNEE